MRLNKILMGSIDHVWSKREAYLIAEIGGNHEGSISKAKDLLISVEAGADAVKFQI